MSDHSPGVVTVRRHRPRKNRTPKYRAYFPTPEGYAGSDWFESSDLGVVRRLAATLAGRLGIDVKDEVQQ